MDATSATGSDKIQVLIADDHRLVAEAVASVLQSDTRFDVTLVDDLGGSLDHLSNNKVDVVLLDFRMPGMVGLESVRQVVRAAGEARVLLFTGQIDRHVMDRALEFGVRGLIPKTMAMRSLSSVIDLVMSGQVFVPVQGEAESATQKMSPAETLSRRELSVLRSAAEGMTNKEIARDMATTEVMVKMHMRTICKKLGARNRAHASILSRELSLL